MISFFSPAALHALGFIALLFMHSFLCLHCHFPVHPRHLQNRAIREAFCRRLYRAFSAFCCFAAPLLRLQDAMLIFVALSTYIHANRFSCKHEICSQKYTSELYHKKKADNITLPTFQPLTMHTTDSSFRSLPLPMPFYRHCMYTFFVRSIFQVAVLRLPFS